MLMTWIAYAMDGSGWHPGTHCPQVTLGVVVLCLNSELTNWHESLEVGMTASRLENSGWEPCDVARSFAKSYGLDPEKVWPEFRDYWTAKSGANATKKDWLATWRTWCRKDQGNPRLALQNAPAHLAGKSAGFSDPTAEAIRTGEIPKCRVTGRPTVTVDGRDYDIMSAWRIKRRRNSKWGISQHERDVLKAWKMAFDVQRKSKR